MKIIHHGNKIAFIMSKEEAVVLACTLGDSTYPYSKKAVEKLGTKHFNVSEEEVFEKVSASTMWSETKKGLIEMVKSND